MKENNTSAQRVQQTPLASINESKRALAIGYAELGLPVFPLVQNGKTPALTGDWKARATTDPDRVADLWTCPVTDAELDYNIGIATGRSFGGGFLMVADIDTRDGKTGDKSLALLEATHGEVPTTFTVRTASGGHHLYFLSGVPVGNSASKVGDYIDIKGLNGYVVGPGSTIDGKVYSLQTAAAIPRAPEWLVKLAGAPRERQMDNATPLVDPDSDTAIRRAIEYLREKAPDNGTYRVATKVKDFGVSKEVCIDLIMEHWPPAEAKGIEHITFRVENAYRYGQNAPGIASAEAEFDAVEVDTKTPPQRRGLMALDWSDVRLNFDQPFLIDNVTGLGTMVVTYGDSNVGKTFIKLDQCFHIAAGRDWNGHKVRQGLVVYVAAEGGTGFLKRIEAYKRRFGVDQLPFVVVPCPIDLQSDRADTGRLTVLIKEAETRHGASCVLVVIDTLARAIAGGDENTAADMSKFVIHCDRVRAATGATVDIIHHTGKDKAKGARGSSALRAATDTELEVDAGALRITKQRDLDRAAEMRFELEPVEIGQRADGAPVTSCVVKWLSAAEADFTTPLDGRQEEALRAFDDAVSAKGDGVLVTFTEWTKAYSDVRLARGKNTGAKQALVRCVKSLLESGHVAKTSTNQYVRTATK